MKYQVGDLVLVKDILLRPRPHPHPRLRLRLRLRRPRPRLLLRLLLKNTLGIITEVEKHSDIFEKDSTESDNAYIWYSQVDGREYYFYEDEIIGEVIK